jgi:Membrane-associating domain
VNKADVWSPDEVNFMLFNGIWTTFLALPFLILSPRIIQAAELKYALLAVDAVTMIFWFAGYIALGAWLGNWLPSSLCKFTWCRVLQAITVLGSFEW